MLGNAALLLNRLSLWAASRYLQFKDDLRHVVKVPVIVQQDKQA